MESLYQIAKDFKSNKPFIFNEKQTSYSEFFSLCKKIKTLLKPLKAGQLLLCQAQSEEFFLSVLMAVLDKGVHFVPVYEQENNTEKELLKKYLMPHWEISNDGKLKALYVSSAKLELPPGVLFQTSGSLGPSKFVYQSEKNLINNALRAKKHQSINKNSKAFVPITLSHTGGLNMQTLPVFISHGQLYLSNKTGFSKLNTFFNQPLTHAVLIPPHLNWITRSPHWKKKKFQNKTTLLTGSCPVSYEFYKITDKKNLRLISVYGLTEIGPFVSLVEKKTLEILEGSFAIGSSDSEFKMKFSPKGEILIKGPCTGKYIKRVKKTKWKILNCGDPWVSSGDRGFKKKDFFYYKGRIKREINLGGFKINPEKIEEILKQHPKVKDCLVYPEKDFRWNEIPAVKIVSESVSASELKAFLSKHTGSLNRPRKWLFVDKLKKTRIEKIKVS